MKDVNKKPAAGSWPSEADDASLEAWLSQARLDPVPDDGFTAAVMQRVPAGPRSSLVRQWPLWGAVLGSALLIGQLAGTGLLPQAVAGNGSVALGGARGVALGCVLGLGLLAAWWAWSEREG